MYLKLKLDSSNILCGRVYSVYNGLSEDCFLEVGLTCRRGNGKSQKFFSLSKMLGKSTTLFDLITMHSVHLGFLKITGKT